MEEQTGGAQMEEDVCLSHHLAYHQVATRMYFRELVAALCLCFSRGLKLSMRTFPSFLSSQT